VKKGTNGGVTKTGILAAAAAGSVIGLSFVLLGFSTTRCESSAAFKQLLVLPIATLAGLCGSLIDSLLGATLQFSGFCSVRRKVNFLTPPIKNILHMNFYVVALRNFSHHLAGCWKARTNSEKDFWFQCS